MADQVMASCTPGACIQTPNYSLQYKKHIKHGFRRLPFVAGRRMESDTPFWHVPLSGGYLGGYETGEAMAMALLKCLREEQEGSSSYLTCITESLMIRFELEGGKTMAEQWPISERSDAYESFRGQYVGFLNTLSPWLAASAQYLGANLDYIAESFLVRQANEGLGFDHIAYMAALSGKK